MTATVPLVLAPSPLGTVPGAVTRALPRSDGRRGDPYRLAARLPSLVTEVEASGRRVDRVLLVAPRRRGLAGTTPGPLLDVGDRWLPVGVLPADRPEQLQTWWAAARGRGAGGVDDQAPRPVVAAMGIDRFLAPAHRWLDELATAGLDPVDRRASCTRREELAEVLATGPDLVLYLGHGHHLGWSGYQGLRWHHLPPQQQPAGTVIALACATLAQPGGQRGFGSRLVTAGRAVAYLGAARPVGTTDLVALGDALVRCLVAGVTGQVPPVRTLGDLVASLPTVLTGDGPAAVSPGEVVRVARALRGLRIVGDPAAPLGERRTLVDAPAATRPTAPARGGGLRPDARRQPLPVRPVGGRRRPST